MEKDIEKPNGDLKFDDMQRADSFMNRFSTNDLSKWYNRYPKLQVEILVNYNGTPKFTELPVQFLPELS